MKLTFAILAIIVGTAYAALPSSEYLPPLEDASPTNNVDLQSIAESSSLTDDGYRYKAVKRLRLRYRRDVNELPSNEYLPPAQSAPAVADIPFVIGSEQTQDSAILANDGYRYKAVKRIRHRHRRDVNELPSNEYLPPVQETQVVEEVAAPAEESVVLADDGYRYKTVKRIRYRHRRDVNELPSNEYLPPVPETQVVEEVAAPAIEVAAPAEESAVLADDGYRYKTVKRVRYRHRRDVNELQSKEYLPPVQETQVVEEVAASAIEVAAPAEESAVLADDGYRYKTVKRIRYRHRRDVNELPSNEYLPPVQETEVVEEVAAPAIEVAAPAEESTVLADDGYRYKTVKRIRYRHRRDVNELPSNEYLPPVQEAQVIEEVAAPAIEVAAPAQESAVLADDGYRYKTVKRNRYRHRRDVNELPSNEYLPPVQETQVVEEVATPAIEEAAPAEESAVLANDGYRYKTVKRIRYRHRRDVNELPSNEYLPPVQETQVVEEVATPAIEVAAPAEESAVLADDGYRYKTVKRIRYRHRRDVNELPSNEYLPPVQDFQVVEAVAAPAEESAVLADDGYRYKTAKRVVFRRRF